MGAGTLLGIALGAIIVLLLLVIRVKMSAFVALLLVAFGTALATGIPLADVVTTMTTGMGNTLSSVMIVVGLGAMLGRLIEVSGGADALAERFSKALGPKRVVAAVTAAAFVLGIPVFFDVGFIILAPIVFAFAKVTGLNPLKIALPVAAVLLTVHVTLAPHPGPVASAALTGADVGLMTIVGLVIAAVVAVVGFFATKLFDLSRITLGPSPATATLAEGTDEGPVVTVGSDEPGTGGGVATVTRVARVHRRHGPARGQRAPAVRLVRRRAHDGPAHRGARRLPGRRPHRRLGEDADRPGGRLRAADRGDHHLRHRRGRRLRQRARGVRHR